MIRMTVLYPASEGATFDHDYYRDVHVPLCIETWGCTAEIDRGVDGPYLAAVHLLFESMEAFETAMARPGTAAVLADVPNYAGNIVPIRQVSETSR